MTVSKNSTTVANGETPPSVHRNNILPPHTGPKETLYILSEVHPDTVKYASTLFNVVEPSNPEAENWRSKAKIIMIRDYWIQEADLAAAPQLKAVAKQGVGIDKIDHEACARHGVKIFNSVGVNSLTVAEMTLALTMNVARNIPKAWLMQMAENKSIPKEDWDGLLLTGKTIGIVGMGNIGRHVGKIFAGAFDARLVCYDPYMPTTGVWEGIAHTRVSSLDELLAVANVVTLHVPLTKETRNLISYEQLQQMKSTSILVNCSRGGIINEDDLVRALDENLIWGAGLDCHTVEPPTKEKYARLWNHDRFISTPHIASSTVDMFISTANFSISNLYKYLETGVPEKAVGYKGAAV